MSLLSAPVALNRLQSQVKYIGRESVRVDAMDNVAAAIEGVDLLLAAVASRDVLLRDAMDELCCVSDNGYVRELIARIDALLASSSGEGE